MTDSKSAGLFVDSVKMRRRTGLRAQGRWQERRRACEMPLHLSPLRLSKRDLGKDRNSLMADGYWTAPTCNTRQRSGPGALQAIALLTTAVPHAAPALP